MKKIRLIVIGAVVFILATITSVYMLFQSDEILINFEITKFFNNHTDFRIEFEELKAADHYVIQMHDSENRKVFELNTDKTNNEFSLTNLQYSEEYSVMVFAYDKLGDYRPCKEAYTFRWDEATFDDDASIILDNNDYVLNILGNVTSKKYNIKVSDGENTLIDQVLTDNSFVLSKAFYENSEKELIVSLISDNVIVDEIKLFNNMNPVSDVFITNIVAEQVIPFNDFTLAYEGGDNANEYEIKVYQGKKCIKTSKTLKKAVVFSKNLFKVSEAYRLEVVAKYNDYFKSTSVDIVMGDQIQLSPVYLSSNPRYVKKGTKLELKCADLNAKIYYTLNGESPESFGTLYTEPIEINENVLLKTVAVLEGYANSVIGEYDINVGVKEKLKVYLSPSNQHGNPGVASTGYTNEMDEMNDITNYIQERLLAHGVKVYRNNPAGNINQWNKDSNYYGVDLKIAIHSNASTNHDNYGIETWVDTNASPTYSIANKIQEGLMSIYPYANLNNANRGVKYANGALGEANDAYIPFGLLVEIAHHDYEADAKWMMENKKLIGYNIADAILKYYQIIE